MIRGDSSLKPGSFNFVWAEKSLVHTVCQYHGSMQAEACKQQNHGSMEAAELCSSRTEACKQQNHGSMKVAEPWKHASGRTEACKQQNYGFIQAAEPWIVAA